MPDLPIELDYQPVLPAKLDHGIAIVGCGSIVQAATLPCYQKHQLHIVGCYDLNRSKAELAAQRFGIPRVYDSLAALLADPTVAIVEIAVMPWAQVDLAQQAIRAGKHLLCQKPLADNFPQATELVQLARAHGVKLAVNQQMRWDPATRAAKMLIQQGRIGEPTDVNIQASLKDIVNPREMWTTPVRRFELFYHSIHYLDSLRFLFGNPLWITSRPARSPLQNNFQGETKTITILDYASGLQAMVITNLANQGLDEHVTYRYLGTEGVIHGTLGLLNYPQGEPDTLTWRSKQGNPAQRFTVQLTGAWFPDAFIGPITSLMQAIDEDGVPETAGLDNLDTLRVIEAAYRSAEENRSVQFGEIR
ncbi:MAG TPA: Gfo/Idh/MocA family oxidoreductase [Caldilineaceae bacterium]|nr:Gfo/Idh/MocA family oxidoreductase [Caldilineaceae bacterium]